MDKGKQRCKFCGAEFLGAGRYCSEECHSLYESDRLTHACGNPACNAWVHTAAKYCSRLCREDAAAIARRRIW